MRFLDRFCKQSLIRVLFNHRFVRFGTVGSSGTIVNMVVLYLNQSIVLKDIYPIKHRLYFSLAVAIFLATLNNYLWNRWWTWGDRKKPTRAGFFVQMGQYYLACGVAIFFQYLITMLLSHFVHYLIANIVGIVFSAIFVYLFNDAWTFSPMKKGIGRVPNRKGKHTGG